MKPVNYLMIMGGILFLLYVTGVGGNDEGLVHMILNINTISLSDMLSNIAFIAALAGTTTLVVGSIVSAATGNLASNLKLIMSTSYLTYLVAFALESVRIINIASEGNPFAKVIMYAIFGPLAIGFIHSCIEWWGTT